jgi:hypothetical protein
MPPGTFHNNPAVDTDMDGVPGHLDRDDDNYGLIDRYERRLGTDAELLDKDGYSVPDMAEFMDGSDTTLDDYDDDGWTDEGEKTSGTDPDDPSSYPGWPHTPGYNAGSTECATQNVTLYK